MATLTDDDQKSQIDKNYEGGSGAYESAGLDQLEANANDPENHNDIADAEKSPQHNSNPMNYARDNAKKQAKSMLAKNGKLGFLKKKGPLMGILGGVGIGVGLAAILGPAAIMIALMQNLTSGLDSASRAMSNRQQRVLRQKIAAPDCSPAKTFACKKTQLSNKTLRKLNKAGLTPMVGDKPVDLSKRTGYPDKKPTAYMLANGDTVNASAISAHLDKDPKLNGKLFGSRGLFNGRTSAWGGQHMKERFRKVFGLKSDGGTSDGKNSKFKGAVEKAKALKEKMSTRVAKIPGMKQGDKVAKIIEKMLGGSDSKGARMKTAKAGGVAYTIAYGACLVSKVPSLVTAGVAGAQILQLLPYINELVLSPGAKLMASGEDSENAITPEDIDVSASILTEKTLDKDGKYTSAMDSPLLLAAMGVNKSKISPSTYEPYIPGYSVVNWFTNGAGKPWKDIQKGAAPACSVIMSPITMYIWAALETAITGTNPITAAGKLILGGIAGLALLPAVMKGIEAVTGSDAFQEALLAGFLEGDLKGIELGHTLGASALAFFPAGAMARFVPGVTVGGAKTAQATVDKYNNDQRIMDIASLSPLDTSSKYTFMGSITHSLRTSAIANGGYTGNIPSIIGSVLRIPQLSLSSRTFAETTSTNMSSICNESNASIYDLESDSAETTPLLNPLGMPCNELEDTLSSDEAVQILEEAGILDTSKEVSDGADIKELIDKGVIKKDNELYMLAAGETGCNDASTGNYLVEAGGCTVLPLTRSSPGDINNDCDFKIGESDNISCVLPEEEDNGETASLGKSNTTATLANSESGDNRILLAAYTFLVDVQAGNAITGEDDEKSSTSEVSGKVVLPLDPGYSITGPFGPDSNYIGPGSMHKGIDLAGRSGDPVYAIADGTIIEPLATGECETRIQHADGSASGYLHLSRTDVKVGDTVTAGQVIGAVGGCGGWDPHLHFEITATESAKPHVVALPSEQKYGRTFYNPTAYMSYYKVDL